MRKLLTHQEFVDWVFRNRPEYEVIGKYIKNCIKIEMKHIVCGNPYIIKPNNFKRGDECQTCNKRGPSPTSHKEFIEWVLKNRSEYEVIGKYINIRIKIEMKHLKCGNHWKINPNCFKNGKSCPYCTNKISKPEKELFNIIKKYYPDAINNQRKLLPNKRFELDIYIPSLKKAIEFNGEYFHSKLNHIEVDKRKKKECKIAGIELFIVWYKKDWINDKEKAIKKCFKFLQ